MGRKSYSFHIHKDDHYTDGRRPDLHVHVYFNEGRSRRLLGRYRLPFLEPIFDAPELNNKEMEFMREWLSDPRQQRKLQDALESTLFDMHKVAARCSEFSKIVEEEGETYLNIRIPVSRRLE
jgi:hypothetical protein